MRLTSLRRRSSATNSAWWICSASTASSAICGSRSMRRRPICRLAAGQRPERWDRSGAGRVSVRNNFELVRADGDDVRIAQRPVAHDRLAVHRGAPGGAEIQDEVLAGLDVSRDARMASRDATGRSSRRGTGRWCRHRANPRPAGRRCLARGRDDFEEHGAPPNCARSPADRPSRSARASADGAAVRAAPPAALSRSGPAAPLLPRA